VTTRRLSSNLDIARHPPPRFGSSHLLDELKIQAWQRMLFLECGDGWIVEEAWRRARRGYICGVDTSAALVARATEIRGVPGALEFKTWNGSRLPYPDACFQRVISTLALECCANPHELCAEMRRVLQPGGDVYLLELQQSAARVKNSLMVMLQQVGFHDVGEFTFCEVILDGGESAAAVIIHARAAPPTVRPQSTAARTAA
jgi:ubiquinone/menaquinone biosynthesis C-methylase UbiE